MSAPSTPGVGVLLRRVNYSVEELEALVEGYEELRSTRKLWIRVRLVDLSRAYMRLSKEHQSAVFLCGFYGLSTRGASPLLNVSHVTVAKRYANGLRAMVRYLNG